MKLAHLSETKRQRPSVDDVTHQEPTREGANPSREQLERKLKLLKADLEDLPQRPSSQAGYDALDDVRDQIKRVEQQLQALSEEVVAEAETAAVQQYDNLVGECLHRTSSIMTLIRKERTDVDWKTVEHVQDVLDKIIEAEDLAKLKIDR